MMASKDLALPLVILGSLIAGAGYTWFVGEDINWDWLNYHEYGAFALLNGRFDIDVAPGGFQTFLNPLAYVPAYLLRHYVGAPYWGPLLGAIHGLNLALIYWLSRVVLGSAANRWTLLASLGIAAFGPMTLSEVGTSFADILTALPLIAGLGFILSADEDRGRDMIVAGLLIGAAVGLKLTNMVFLIGAGTCLLLAQRPLPAMARFAGGSAVGAIVTGGFWSWKLWQEFGNPVFPFYNTVFRSPEAPLAAIADVRFMPRGLLDAAAYPFYWLVGDHRSSEWAFRDPRFAVLIVVFALALGARLLWKEKIFQRRDKQFLLFFAVAYGMWLLTFSIRRYAIALEILAAPLIVLLLVRLMQAIERRRETIDPSKAANGLVTVTALAIAVWSQPADWFRRSWSNPYRPQLAESLSVPATYLMIQKPLGYVVPLLPAGSRAYQVSDIVMPIAHGGSLDRRIRSGLARPLQGGVWALHLHGSAPRQDLLDVYGLVFDPSRTCEFIPGADHTDIKACPLIYASEPASSAEPS
jgi:Glycosyltransferase family 87